MTPAELSHFAVEIAEAVAEKLANRPRLVDKVALSEMIGLSVPTIDRRPEIPRIRVGSRVLFDPDAVIEALSSGGSDDE